MAAFNSYPAFDPGVMSLSFQRNCGSFLVQYLPPPPSGVAPLPLQAMPCAIALGAVGFKRDLSAPLAPDALSDQANGGRRRFRPVGISALRAGLGLQLDFPMTWPRILWGLVCLKEPPKRSSPVGKTHWRVGQFEIHTFDLQIGILLVGRLWR